jgi:hypothetical protein
MVTGTGFAMLLTLCCCGQKHNCNRWACRLFTLIGVHHHMNPLPLTMGIDAQGPPLLNMILLITEGAAGHARPLVNPSRAHCLTGNLFLILCTRTCPYHALNPLHHPYLLHAQLMAGLVQPLVPPYMHHVRTLPDCG